MPVRHEIWTVGAQPIALAPTTLVSEAQLEEMNVRAPQILSPQWMLIGRQENTGLGGRIDLLASAPDGALVLIELKRDRTPRELVAQALYYASGVEKLTAERIAKIYQRFSNGGNLAEAFRKFFGTAFDEETLNITHSIVLVAAELDPATERILGYLNSRDIAINAIFFQVFQMGDQKLLSRAWLIDPGETQVNAASSGGSAEKEPWNGEFYVSYGDRSWNDARRYGFICGGGGSWYSQTLKLLAPGDRIWVKIPKKGCVGVGIVTEESQSALDFKVQTAEGERPCLEVLENAEVFRQRSANPETAEYFVRVKWLDSVAENAAVTEVGLFGNQNTVCQPTTPKWRHTIDRLKERFPRWDAPSDVDPRRAQDSSGVRL